ncbi:MAG: endonuclease/exonuclease/phosphatase family protein [Puniceicoccales bacterium]|jgi:endonuclease/exonuclease/phosphatase family metal-dependent hydrolase|nr:endonuclease/exonuclease/phosphatase family protein [Puniceicoccales bacterium]
MRSPVLLFLLSGLLAITGTLRAERLRVATYNLENYNLANRRVEGRGEPSYPKPEKEKAALRRILHATNADLVALQEIGGADYVRELQRDLAREGLPYPHTAILAGPDTQRQLAIISRKPFARIHPHARLPIRYQDKANEISRGLLAVTLNTSAGKLTLYTLHLKSRITVESSDPGAAARRLAEADTIRALLHAAHAPEAATALVILMGDFNDGPQSATLRQFTNARRQPVFHVLPARDSRGETWTYRNLRHEYYSRSDYILHTPALGAYLRPPARIADIPDAHTASDHRLVCADMDFGDNATAAGLKASKASGTQGAATPRRPDRP